MAGSLLFPAAMSSSSSWFSSPSRPSHARREHRRQCPVCKTVCVVELAVLIYVNRHTARRCGGKGEMRMGGEDCRRRRRRDDPDPPRGCGDDGPKGATAAGRDARASPPHIDGSNDGSGGCGGAPCSLLSSLAVAAARGQRHGDDGDNGDNDGNDGVHSDCSEHSDGGDGDGKGTPPQPPPPSLPTQLLVLACFVVLFLLLF
jgi:hypothetical protein